MFKYNLDQIIFYLMENRIHSAPVISRIYVDNLNQDWACTKEQKELFTRFGNNCIKYSTCHGEIEENKAFSNLSIFS